MLEPLMNIAEIAAYLRTTPEETIRFLEAAQVRYLSPVSGEVLIPESDVHRAVQLALDQSRTRPEEPAEAPDFPFDEEEDPDFEIKDDADEPAQRTVLESLEESGLDVGVVSALEAEGWHADDVDAVLRAADRNAKDRASAISLANYVLGDPGRRAQARSSAQS